MCVYQKDPGIGHIFPNIYNPDVCETILSEGGSVPKNKKLHTPSFSH